MLNKWRAIALSALLGATLSVDATAQPKRVPSVVVPASSFEESYFERRNIGSWATLVGWEFGGLKGRINSPRVIVSGLRDEDKTLCVTIQSADGSYLGTARLANPRAGSTLLLQLPSTLFRRQGETSSIDLALLARASRSANCTTSSPVLGAWWADLPASAPMHVRLSAAVGSEVRLMLQGAAGPTNCRPLEELDPSPRKNRQRYNTICQAPLPATCRADTAFEIIVESGSGRGRPQAGVLRRNCA